MLIQLLLVYFTFCNKFLYAKYCDNNAYNVKLQTNTSSCFIWGNYHVKTFDDASFNFRSNRDIYLFTVVSLNFDGRDFKIAVGNYKDPGRTIKFLYYDEIYKLTLNDFGSLSFSKGQYKLLLPYESKHLRVHQPGMRIIVEFLDIGIAIRWDTQAVIQITVLNSKNLQMQGLCGNNDKCSSNDDFDMGNNLYCAQVENILQDNIINRMQCRYGITANSPCGTDRLLQKEGYTKCSETLYNQDFREANKILNPKLYINTCTWDYCYFTLSQYLQERLCDSFDVYAKASLDADHGISIDWRNRNTCGKRCSGDLEFYPCAPDGVLLECGSNSPAKISEICEEGCYCPPSLHLFKGRCYVKKDCPCSYMGREYDSGESLKEACKICTCSDGIFNCKSKPCFKEACAFGDPHYKTWDGKKYDFMGQCAYYLVMHREFNVSGDNYALADGEFVKDDSNSPSYIRKVTIKMYDNVIELLPNLVAAVNGKPVKKFPHALGPIIITKPSSMFISVDLPNKVNIKWDGYSTACVKIPMAMKTRVSGLFGTYTEDQEDDFQTATGEILTNAIEFGNSWKTEDSCQDAPLDEIPHPCDVNPEARDEAERICNAIRSDIFQRCHLQDVVVYFDNCVYDTCLCKQNPGRCACDIIAAFADGCSKENITVNWRKRISECKISCPHGQIYQECGDPCRRTCADLSLRTECEPYCVEGCNCPPGTTLDDNGKCITINKCKCRIENILYPPGFQLIQNENSLVTCKNAQWISTKPTAQEKDNLDDTSTLNQRCDVENYSAYTPCMLDTPITCQNMEEYVETSIRICEEGCQCMVGYVLDMDRRICVKPENCPCIKRGLTYAQGDRVTDGCHTCVCQNGEFICNDDTCEQSQKCTKEDDIKWDNNGKCICKHGEWKCIEGQCDIWGNSHVKTFDGHYFDFEGLCSYILANGKVGNKEFLIYFQTERCSKQNDTCLKSFTINVNINGRKERIEFEKGKKIPNVNGLWTLNLTDKFLYIQVDVPNAGIQVFWDQNTWVYVKLDSRWQKNVYGLCANYDGSKDDDKQLSAANSWRLDQDCDPVEPTANNCNQNRVKWAESKCGILLSPKFAQCNDRVPVNPYYKACIMDACKCDTGGDCECLCTSIATYVQKCNNYGISISWRTQNFCPIECSDTNTHYESCAPNCPPKTCGNYKTYKCDDYSCKEGCALKTLPNGHVYADDAYEKIVLESQCEFDKCLQNGVVYYHGEIINNGDKCEICYCDNGKVYCMDTDCEQDTSPSTTTAITTQSICGKDDCVTPNCPAGATLHLVPGQCCPTCQAKNECILLNSNTLVKKKPGETWNDKCRECTCEGNAPFEYCFRCKSKICTEITDRSAIIGDIQYLYERDKCCKALKPAQCVHNNKFYRVGEEWSVDKCTSLKCFEDTSIGIVMKLKIEEICNENCSIGYEYIKSPNDCCGKCIQNSCIFENQIKNNGDVWYPKGECIAYRCKQSLGRYQIIVQEMKCPEITQCSGEIVKGRCCYYCSTSELFEWEEESPTCFSVNSL